MLVPEQTQDLEIEHAPLEDMGASMLTFDIPQRSRLHGVDIAELRLPQDALVSLILRGDRLFVPDAQTRLRAGDHLLLAVQREHRQKVESRLRAISRAGRLARWHGELGEEGGA